MQLGFGSGVAWATPLTDANGNAIAIPTPSQLGVLQDASIDWSYDTKMLYGQQQFPVALGRGKGKIGLKAKLAQITGRVYADIFSGQANASSIYSAVYDTTGIAIPTTPFTITANTTAPTATTIQIPSSGVWAADLGVKNANGVQLQRVAAGPTTGQYTVAAGVYVFAAADVGQVVYISYQYTAASTTAKKLSVSNLVMGAAPTFRCDVYVPYQGKNLLITLPNCIANKVGIPTKQDDFLIYELDLDCFADSLNNCIYMGTSE